MNLRNPPQDFAPAWIARVRERRERAWKNRLLGMQLEAQGRAMQYELEAIEARRKNPPILA